MFVLGFLKFTSATIFDYLSLFATVQRLFATIRDYSSLFATIQRLFETIRHYSGLFNDYSRLIRDYSTAIRIFQTPFEAVNSAHKEEITSLFKNSLNELQSLKAASLTLSYARVKWRTQFTTLTRGRGEKTNTHSLQKDCVTTPCREDNVCK